MKKRYFAGPSITGNKEDAMMNETFPLVRTASTSGSSREELELRRQVTEALSEFGDYSAEEIEELMMCLDRLGVKSTKAFSMIEQSTMESFNVKPANAGILLKKFGGKTTSGAASGLKCGGLSMAGDVLSVIVNLACFIAWIVFWVHLANSDKTCCGRPGRNTTNEDY